MVCATRSSITGSGPGEVKMMRSTFVDVLDLNRQCSCAAKNPKTAGVDKVMQSLVAVVTQRDSVRVLHAFTLCGKEHEERRSVCVPWVMHACISCDADENGNVGKSDA